MFFVPVIRDPREWIPRARTLYYSINFVLRVLKKRFNVCLITISISINYNTFEIKIVNLQRNQSFHLQKKKNRFSFNNKMKHTREQNYFNFCKIVLKKSEIFVRYLGKDEVAARTGLSRIRRALRPNEFRPNRG